MVINKRNKYSCPKCQEKFRLKNSYKNHIKKHKTKKFREYGDMVF